MFKCFSLDSSNSISFGSCTLLVSVSILLVNGLGANLATASESQTFSQETYSWRKLVAQDLNSTITNDYLVLGEEILAEINRVRTNPQAYAEWLEARKQYFEGTVLKLPGEKPIRTNRGKEALEEAVALLKKQSPLPQLSSTSELAGMAQEQISIVTSRQANLNLQDKTVSYGKYTAEGIVMQLVIDDGNRFRLNRQKILNPNIRSVGITCQAHEQYDNICAIAYEGDFPEIIVENTEEVNSEPNEIVVTTREETRETESTNDANSDVSSLPTPNTRNNPSLLLEKIQQGKLEEGDPTIPNDGSFYDSYPLEGNAGDSFIISVESQEFDTFLAVMDREGNILEQNDDISENNSNSQIKVILPSKGVYSVIVNAYDEGGKGDYLLTVRR